MRISTTLTGIFLAALIIQPASATSCDWMPLPAPPAAPASVGERNGLALAEAYMPHDLLMGQLDSQVTAGFMAALDNDAQARARAASDPDAAALALDVTLRFTRACAPAFIIGAQREVATVMAENMTPAQLQDVLRFYQSPAGVRMVAAISNTVPPLVPTVNADGSIQPITLAQARAHLARPTEQAFYSLTQSDRIALNQFGTRPAGQAFINLGPALQQIILRRVNAFNRDMTPHLHRAIAEAIAARTNR